MNLTDDQLLEFRDRCIQAVHNGYSIGLAEEYVRVLAQEVGQEVVPEGVMKGSAPHLLDLANQALDQRKGGARVKAAKNEEPKPAKVAPSEEVPPAQPKAEETAEVQPEAKSETKVEEKVEPVKEAPKAEEKKPSSKKK